MDRASVYGTEDTGSIPVDGIVFFKALLTERLVLGFLQKQWLRDLRMNLFRKIRGKLKGVRDDERDAMGVLVYTLERLGKESGTNLNGLILDAKAEEAMKLRSQLAIVLLNDSAKTFEEIADEIESKPDLYFKGTA